jgi:hypothetical protein
MIDLTVSAQERHDRFIRRVIASGEVWSLKSQDGGWCNAPSNDEEADVMPFWSDRAYAKQCAKDEWQGYEPVAIPLSAFLSRWLTGMSRDGLLVGTNWNAHLIGLEVDPLVLKQEIEEQMLD